jgi:hypothetical protein
MKNITIKGLDENDLGKDSLAELMRIENGALAKESGQLAKAAINGGKAVINKLNQNNKKTGHWRKLGDSKIGVKRDEKTKKKIKEGTQDKWRIIIQYTKDGKFIKEWENFTVIRDELGFAHTNICNCCKHYEYKKEGFKSSYGFVWKYK